MPGPAALSECSLMVATPLYDGAQGSYVNSAIAFSREAERIGLPVQFTFLMHEPLISRARNTLLHMMLRGEATHIAFIDGDIGFEPQTLTDIVQRMVAQPDYAIMGAPCPKRNQNWANIAKAAKRGLAADDPATLARFGGDFAIDLVDPAASFRLDEPVEVKRLGTGLMVIRRDVVETLCEKHPELAYRPSAKDRALGSSGGDLAEDIHALFQSMIEPETRHFLSDDYAFCRRVRDAGFRIWLAPWLRTTHTGPAIFQGALADLAPLFSSNPTPQE